LLEAFSTNGTANRLGVPVLPADTSTTSAGL